MTLEERIRELVNETVKAAGRPDLFREPLCAFSAAGDARYEDLKTLVGPWVKSPRELLPDARSVISCFVPFTHEVVTAARREEPVARVWGEAYVTLNALFDVIGAVLAEFLRREGYSALPIAATGTYDPVRLESAWSHRSAAAIAGLGRFGVNRMLITGKGSAGRFCSVLTSAPLQPAAELATERCLHNIQGGCLVCLKACPVNALGVGSFAKFDCHDRLVENGACLADLDCDVCGKCLVHCPVADLD